MTLTEIATEMKTQAAANLGQPVRRRLRGGLRLVMVSTITRHQLSLIREGVEPSSKEVDVIRRDFSVPPAARMEERQQPVQQKLYHIIRLIWPRAAQMTMLADTPQGVVVGLTDQQD